ncbi:MAG: GTP-binding protein TypA/BipA [uncultured Thermomicrobiales bacterium]|uniref:Large ribosomal subunit assembly factor BipA n=1 Tax=uncultured Thermomicrobiales bacterium TaxID=1645740 RepID=A0A6J4VE47_9BACT|nr:MAG: GTP-binding protein TypA/BipA [uncultured Thermomicrobiales bacterium]
MVSPVIDQTAPAMGDAPTRTAPALRNVAIIAHVDHGKTTLVDGLLKQSNIFRDPDAAGTLIMDANDLERERGITILAKNTAITYGGVKINIIDTPGHADFGGEVERVLSMADGCLLLVDAVEGPMPQTRTVLAQALALGLRPIVVVNKVDRANARPAEVVSLTQDLFLDLATDADQLEFPVIYSIARDGRAGLAPDALQADLRPLLDTIIREVPAPTADPDAPAQLLVASLDADAHRGRIAIGRVQRGRIRAGDTLLQIAIDGETSRQKVSHLAVFDGLGRREVPEVVAGDIVAIAGFSEAKIGATLTDPATPEALSAPLVEEPTLKLTFGVNTSPFAGREGQYSTSRQLRERLFRELETNLSLRVAPTDQPDVFAVSGRGELHLSVLIETMRREGFEFQVSRPEVITREVDGELQEPIEQLTIDTTEPFVGVVTELVGGRRARMLDMTNDGRGAVRLEFAIPTRGLIGLRNAFLTATKGNGVLSSRLIGYEPWQGPIVSNRTGALVASETGVSLSHGLANAQERGITFIEPQTEVYEGMVVGQQPRPGDLAVNVCRAKKLTNIRSSTSDIGIRLTPPVILSLEQSLDFLADDELLEVTPKGWRLRKRLLTQDERNKAKKRAQEATASRA